MMKYKHVLLVLLGFCFFAGCAMVQQTGPMAAGPDVYVPVRFPMPFAGSTASSSQLTLQSQTSDLQVPAQISATDQELNTHYIYASALVPIEMARGGQFKLKQTHNPIVKTDSFHWEDDGKTTLTLRQGKREIFAYHYGMIMPPKGVPSHRTRSSYFHPVLGLDGETLTEDFPPDHHHHRGLYHAWPGVFMNGQRYDMWHILGMWTRFERVLAQEEGPVFAKLILESGWYTTERKVMDEVMNVTVWHSDDMGQAIDLKFIWTPLTKIHIGPKDKKGYGGLNYRFPARKDTIVMAPTGKQKTSDLKRFPWVDFSGRFDKEKTRSGIDFMVNPNNIDPNPGWTLRCEDNYGYIGVSWPGLEGFDFEPGKIYSNSYRLWIHRGDTQDFDAPELFKAYAEPPKIKVVSK